MKAAGNGQRGKGTPKKPAYEPPKVTMLLTEVECAGLLSGVMYKMGVHPLAATNDAFDLLRRYVRRRA